MGGYICFHIRHAVSHRKEAGHDRLFSDVVFRGYVDRDHTGFYTLVLHSDYKIKGF